MNDLYNGLKASCIAVIVSLASISGYSSFTGEVEGSPTSGNCKQGLALGICRLSDWNPMKVLIILDILTAKRVGTMRGRLEDGHWSLVGLNRSA